MKKNNTLIYVILVLLSLFILSGMLYCTYKYPREIIKRDTITTCDTLWRDTTIYKKQLVPKKIVEIKRDTITKDTVLVTESKEYEKSLISGKDTCDLKLYVSGIEPSLDSLEMRLKTHTEVNTVEITNYVEKKKTVWDKFNVGVGIGYGIGLKNKDFEPFVGVSLVYNL